MVDVTKIFEYALGFFLLKTKINETQKTKIKWWFFIVGIEFSINQLVHVHIP